QGNTLDVEQYKQLAEKSENNPVQYYGSVQKGMFNYIVMQYMHPDSNMKSMGSMDGMENMEGMHDMGNMKSMSGMDHTQHMQHMKDMDAEQHSGLSSSTHSTTEHSSTASGEAE
ncbi:MAG TPA: ubiquinol oxidase subunit II, partial [Shewanella frigidimarina]|nr:ubiquinol oxidase subunit II [Shewanella frigidimarina]